MMNVAIRPEHQRYIEEQVRAGRYGSADDAVADALERLRTDDAEPTSEDIAAIREGLDQLNRGEGRPWDEVRGELVTKFGLKG